MQRAPELQRQVVDAPVPNVRVGAAPTAETYGGQVADLITHQSVKWYDLETRYANQTATFEADRQLANKQTELEGQLAQLEGKAVLGADAQLMEQFDAASAKIEEGLANGQQRGAFRHTQALRRQQLNDTTQRYVRTEYSAYQDLETTGTIASAKDRTRRNPESPMIIEAERARALSAVAAWGERKGLRGEITAEMLADPRFQNEWRRDTGQAPPTLEEMQMPGQSNRFESQAYKERATIVNSGLHKEVVEGLLAHDNDQAAKTYATKYKDQFTADDLDAVEKSVLEGSTRGESRRQAMDIVATHDIGTVEGRREALKVADGIKNDKVADATRVRLEHQFSVHDQRKREQYDERFLTASKLIEEQGLKNRSAGVRDLVPVPLWNEVKPKDQAALELHLKRLRTPEEHGHEPMVWLKFSELKNEQLARVPSNVLLRDYLNHFDGTHYDRAINDWNTARNLAAKGDDKFMVALTPREEIMNAWVESGIVDNSKPRGKWTKEEETYYNRFESQAARSLSALPKDAKPAEVQKVLKDLSDKMLKQKYTVDPGMFRFNQQVPAIGMTDVQGARSVRIPIAEVPAAEQDMLKGLLRTAEKPVTTDKLERLWAVKKQLLDGLLPKDAAKTQMKAIILE